MADRSEGRPAMHVVYGLVDASGNLGLVSWRNVNSPAAWRAVWVARSALPDTSKLAAWMRGLPTEPTEVILLGSSARLNRREATTIAAAMSDLLRPVVLPPRPWERRPVGRIDKEGSMFWPSIEAAARALGTNRFIIDGRLRRGRMFKVP